MAYTTIDDPELYFQVATYTGNSSSGNAITLGGDTDLSPNMVWLKGRSNAQPWGEFDSVRGGSKILQSNTNGAELTDVNAIESFDSDGFTVGSDSNYNYNTYTYAAWCWKESATSGFDIVTYTGNGTDDTDIAHSLSAVPHVMIVKCRSDAEGWMVYHHKNTAAPETDYLELNSANATADAADKWSDEAPTSSVFTLGDNPSNNGSSRTYVNYLFTEKQGFSKFGYYTGNSNADGAFVYLGFKPAWVLIKKYSGSNAWFLWDNKRDGFNGHNDTLFPASTSEEEQGTSYVRIDLLSNGFKFRHSDGDHNGSGADYVYMAFAEAPFVNSNGVPCNAR